MLDVVAAMRSYGDPCGIARALDIVGERWAILVARELVLGPKRFTDLRAGLPAASPNVLAQRLRELEEEGVVRRRMLEPPANAWVYELTDWGRDLEPLIRELARWGSRAPRLEGGELSLDAMMLALTTTFDAKAAGDLRMTVELRFGLERFRVHITAGRIALTRGAARDPDAIMTTDVPTLRGLVFGGRSVSDAARGGKLEIEGDRQVVARFVKLFPRPVPVSTPR